MACNVQRPPAAFGDTDSAVSYRFGGSDRVYLVPSATHFASRRLARTSRDSMRNHPCIARPRISMKQAFVVCVRRSESAGSTRTWRPALAAGRHRQVACDEECEPAKHLLLGQAWLASQQLANAISHALVIGHGASYGPAPPTVSRRLV